MASTTASCGFVECADLVSGQKYGAALKLFQQAVANFRDSKTTPKRNEIARQLFQIGAALEETLKQAYGEQWDSHVPKFAEETAADGCSFCGKAREEVGRLIAGLSVQICDECIALCAGILDKEGHQVESPTDNVARDAAETLCGICMESRETDELIFLPHAAYLCAGCLEEMQLVRDRQAEK